jgi:aldose 1-epimerase
MLAGKVTRKMEPHIVTLTDASAGSEAKVLTSHGFNCFAFRILVGQRPVDVIWAEPGFERGDKRPSGSGIPLLFPYPGRLRGRQLQWESRDYTLEGDDGRGNAIHGFVLTRPWRVVDQSATHVVGQFTASHDDPRLRECWPADFCITATYELRAGTLRSSFVIENPDVKPLPFGFGTHPYFHVPLGGDSAEACLVQLPMQRRWELKDMLPTGRSLPIEDVDQYHAGLRFGDMSFDDVLSGLEFDAGWCSPRVIDPQSGRELIIQFNEAFRECVVYTPPHRQAVCIEPYTCVPNAPELRGDGIDAGLRILPPGERFGAEMVMSVK